MKKCGQASVLKPTSQEALARLKSLKKAVSKLIGRATTDYRMINEADRILVAVSGGKDSLALVKLLSDRRDFVPVRYDLVAVHVDLGYHCMSADVLKEYLAADGIDLHIRKKDILKGKTRDQITCFWCSWNRRKAFFDAAREFNCNKIALGHHKDDIIETILMNMFFEGQISAMSPCQEMFEGKMTIIRPLAYVEESQTLELAQLAGYPVPRCACPNAKTSKRTQVKALIKSLEEDHPTLKTNIFKSLQRIKADYLL